MRLIALGLAVFVASPSPAAAQLTAKQARAVRQKASVLVVASTGTSTGRLLDMDSVTVTIQPQEGAARTWPLAEVLRIETTKWDSPYDGAIAGGLVMFVWSLIAGATIGAEAPNKGKLTLRLSVVGMLLGGAIDASRRSRVTLALYERSHCQVVRKTPGAFFTVRF